MQDKKILVTGVTGQVAYPFALHHVANNEVWAIARFNDQDKKARLESAGVNCVTVDLADPDFSGLPTDFDAVFHFAVTRIDGSDFDFESLCNAEATGALMSFCRGAKRFFHCSSTAVYEADGHNAFTETSPLGDNHRCMMPTYSIGKIAVESVVKFCAKEFNLPTVICRLNTPYGKSGWPFYHLMMMQNDIEIPVHSDAPSQYTLMHQDDINRLAPLMLEAAAVPAPVYNFCGQEHVAIEEWCAYIGELTGLTPRFKASDDTLESVITDNSKMQALVGPAQVHWRDGIRALVEAAGALKSA